MPSFYDNTKKAKNYIMNGAMDFFQRGTSFTSISGGTYYADRFAYNKNGTMAHTVSKDTDVPTLAQSGFIFPSSSLFTLTTAQASLTTNQYCSLIGHKVEGQFFAPLQGRQINISFWVKSNVVGIYPVGLRNSNATRSYVTTFTINTANTWEKKSLTITHDSSGTQDYTTAVGLNMAITVGSDGAFQVPTLNTWTTGQYFSHSSCTNAISSLTLVSGSTAPTFRFTGFQLEEGSLPSAFNRAGENVASELLLCQRYFNKSFEINTTPANGADATSMADSNNTVNIFGINYLRSISVEFPTTMRTAVPTMTMYGNSSGQWNYAGNNTNVVYSSNVTVSYSTAKRFFVSQQAFGGVCIVLLHYTADSEL